MPTAISTHYNIALRPVDPAIGEKLVVAAQPLAAIADEYLLGAEALPHVTLCQFRATDKQAAANAFELWGDHRIVTVTLAKLTPNAHGGFVWSAINTEKDDRLLSLQKNLYDHLTALGLDALTKPETYNPHFTLARCRETDQRQDNPQDLPVGLKIECAAAIGESSKTGVFLRHLTV